MLPGHTQGQLRLVSQGSFTFGLCLAEHRAETSNGRADIWGANDEASAWGGASVSQATEGLPEENKQTAADWGASGEKLTPWGAPIPEAEPETDWGRPVAADAGESHKWLHGLCNLSSDLQ